MEVLELDRPDVFPVETPVGIYPASAVIDFASAPLGSPIQTVKVGFVETKEEKDVFDTKTKIKFEVATKGHYVAGAKVGGVWRYVRVPVGDLETNLTPPARYPAHHV